MSLLFTSRERRSVGVMIIRQPDLLAAFTNEGHNVTKPKRRRTGPWSTSGLAGCRPEKVGKGEIKLGSNGNRCSAAEI